MPRVLPKVPAAVTLPPAESKPLTTPKATVAQPQTAVSTFEQRAAQVTRLLEGHTDRGEEKQLLAIFRDASAGDLNGIIRSMSLHDFHELLGDMNDRWFGPDNRTAFMTLMVRERLPELDVESRARLISALQVHKTGSHDEAAMRDIFLATKGPDLTALKNAIDAGGDYRDLQQLVFHDLDDDSVRADLLAHFATEGASNGQVKVLSDIDDTFYANLKDDRYPAKTVYPGVRAFYAELDAGGAAAADRAGDLSFLSARPYDRPGVSEHETTKMLKANGVQATVMSGDFAHLVGNELIADKKYDNWQQSRQIFPEYGSVFTGDSGQGDAIFGVRAVAANDGMQAVFIHNVTGLDAAAKASFAARGVDVFDTYVGAATAAFGKGLITREGLSRVADAAIAELQATRFDDPAQRAAREAELARDLAAMP